MNKRWQELCFAKNQKRTPNYRQNILRVVNADVEGDKIIRQLTDPSARRQMFCHEDSNGCQGEIQAETRSPEGEGLRASESLGREFIDAAIRHTLTGHACSGK